MERRLHYFFFLTIRYQFPQMAALLDLQDLYRTDLNLLQVL